MNAIEQLDEQLVFYKSVRARLQNLRDCVTENFKNDGSTAWTMVFYDAMEEVNEKLAKVDMKIYKAEEAKFKAQRQEVVEIREAQLRGIEKASNVTTVKNFRDELELGVPKWAD